MLWQAWETPDGPLRQAVRLKDACAGWQTIRWNDAAASCLHAPLIREAADVARFAYLFGPLTDADFDAWRAATAPAFAHAAALRNIELARAAGVHLLKRFGGYEMCNLYSPDIWRRVCRPRLQAEVRRAHDLGLPVFYRVVTGMEPLLDDIAALGFDAIEGGEPHLSGCSLRRWHDAFAGRAASWTGISSPVLLGGDDPEAVRGEVRAAVEIWGRRGFVLGVTNSIRAHFPWANTLALVDEWKKVR